MTARNTRGTRASDPEPLQKKLLKRGTPLPYSFGHVVGLRFAHHREKIHRDRVTLREVCWNTSCTVLSCFVLAHPIYYLRYFFFSLAPSQTQLNLAPESLSMLSPPPPSPLRYVPPFLF